MHQNSEKTCGCFNFCYNTKVTVKVAVRKILSTNLVIFVAQDMELTTMNLMIICINAQKTITGARVGHKRSSESFSFVIASREFMSFHGKRQIRRVVNLSSKTYDK